MEYDASLLKYEVDEMMSIPAPPKSNWTVTIITPAEEIPALEMLAHDSVCDFRENYGEEANVELVIGAGTYQYKVLPHKEDLKIRITRTQVNTDESQSMVYQGLLLGVKSDLVSQFNSADSNVTIGDINGVEVVTLQLREFVMSYIQAVTVGSIFRNTTPAQVLSAMLLSYGQDDTLDLEYRVKGLTMQPPDNTEVRKQIVINHGTRLTALGDHLQGKGGGIYSSGLGMFLMRGMWYIWGLYDLRYEQPSARLRIVMIPERRYRGLDRSWRQNDSELVILATGYRDHADPTDTRSLNDGNAVRFADSRKLLEGFSQTQGNKGIVKRTENASEYTGYARGNNQVFAPTVQSTDNPFAEASRLVGRNGSFLVCTWENSEPELLRPDMTVNVVINRNGLPMEIPARLMRIQSYTYKVQPGLTNLQKARKTSLALYLSNEYAQMAESSLT